MVEQTQPTPTRSPLRGLEKAALWSTVLVWLGVILTAAGLFLAYRHRETQAAAWAEATAIASTAEVGIGWLGPISPPTPTFTVTPTATPEVFPSGWSTATPAPTSAAGLGMPTTVLSRRTRQPTATPTPIPLDGPPHRLLITKIELDATVVPISWHETTENGEQVVVWQVADNAVGWHETSAQLGARGNVVLNGHHNVKGQVFRYLVDLEPGDLVELHGSNRIHYYRVSEKHILKEKDEPLEVRRQNAEWIGPAADQRLTMVTCWPFTNNTHRLVVVAKPAADVKDRATEKGLKSE